MTDKNILFYALGGGLGHLTRVLSIILQSEFEGFTCRVLASSPYTSLVKSYFPCSIDVVPHSLRTSRHLFRQYLRTYLEQYHIHIVVLDTFPFGIVGEFLKLDYHIRCLLIARNLKWNVYKNILDSDFGNFPEQSLIIEPLEPIYEETLLNQSECKSIDGPLLLDEVFNDTIKPSNERPLIVHSGTEAERLHLLSIASSHSAGKNNEVEIVEPGKGIFPGWKVIRYHQTIISGGGYNMSALAFALSDNPERTFFLHPFQRRYDDQAHRIRLIKEGIWLPTKENAAGTAAQFITEQCYQSQRG